MFCLPNISYNRLSERKVQNWGGTLSKVTNIYHWGVNKVSQFTFVPIHWWLRTFFWECIKRDFPDFIMSQITNTSQTLMSYFLLIKFFFLSRKCWELWAERKQSVKLWYPSCWLILQQPLQCLWTLFIPLFFPTWRRERRFQLSLSVNKLNKI